MYRSFRMLKVDFSSNYCQSFQQVVILEEIGNKVYIYMVLCEINDFMENWFKFNLMLYFGILKNILFIL